MRTLKAALASGLCLSTLSVCLLAGQGTISTAPVHSDRTIRVDVDLVLVNVTVTDRLNRFVQGLSKEHFQVFEDKVEQEIATFSGEDTPVSLGIILDKSGSMGVTKPRATDSRSPSIFEEARTYAFQCLKDGIRGDEYFLIEFSSKAQVVADFTNDFTKLREKLLFTEAGGRTALWDAIYAGVTKLQDAMHTRKALLVLSDGVENNSRYTLLNLKEMLREQDIRIYGVNERDLRMGERTKLFSSTVWLNSSSSPAAGISQAATPARNSRPISRINTFSDIARRIARLTAPFGRLQFVSIPPACPRV